MKYILFIAVDPVGEQNNDDPEAWVEHWNTRGVRLEGNGLEALSDTKTVRVRGDRVMVTDGPFAETTEWIAGYDLIEAADLDEAIEVAGGHPMATSGRVEIRPVDELDFGPGTENVPHEGDVPASRFLALFRRDPSAQPHAPEPDAVASWIKDGLASGRYLGGHHLKPVDDATLVRRRGGELLVTDGAYNDVPESVTGIAFIDGDWDAALDFVARAPMARSGIAELREFWAGF